MKVPIPLTRAFGKSFEEQISRFAARLELMPDPESINSPRFLARSVVPHILKLSSQFNRIDGEQGDGLDPYWSKSSNPANLRLAYFLYFMPSNLYRVAAVWSELARLGYRWSAGTQLRGVELGAGPATGACGIAAGEFHAPLGLPRSGNWALIEQDRATLDLGAKWAEEYFASQEVGDWGIRTFQRRLDFGKPLMPAAAPKFNLWLASYFLNEATESPAQIASRLLDSWEKHLDEEGLVILVEPALKLQSRRLLELRKALLAEKEKRGNDWLQVLLPCMGHQSCGALAAEEDWCHEDVSWWRPPYFRVLDQMAELDRKSLPFSYLVLTRSKRPREELLPALAQSDPTRRYRLVSPAHSQGREKEFFVCGQDGKRRARYKPVGDQGDELGRGDVLIDAEIRGDVNASRVQTVKTIG